MPATLVGNLEMRLKDLWTSAPNHKGTIAENGAKQTVCGGKIKAFLALSFAVKLELLG
jgi:hypothetical protein